MPNPLNYATREASQKLLDNGIMLETENIWVWVDREWILSKKEHYATFVPRYPAPSFAEVWRELPEEIIVKDNFLKYRILLWKYGGKSYCAYINNYNDFGSEFFFNINPTDALIELKIWVEGDKSER
jgi:hypothetical protein